MSKQATVSRTCTCNTNSIHNCWPGSPMVAWRKGGRLACLKALLQAVACRRGTGCKVGLLGQRLDAWELGPCAAGMGCRHRVGVPCKGRRLQCELSDFQIAELQLPSCLDFGASGFSSSRVFGLACHYSTRSCRLRTCRVHKVGLSDLGILFCPHWHLKAFRILPTGSQEALERSDSLALSEL